MNANTIAPPINWSGSSIHDQILNMFYTLRILIFRKVSFNPPRTVHSYTLHNKSSASEMIDIIFGSCFVNSMWQKKTVWPNGWCLVQFTGDAGKQHGCNYKNKAHSFSFMCHAKKTDP